MDTSRTEIEDDKKFVKKAIELANYISKYILSIRRDTCPSIVERGFLFSSVPKEAPEYPDEWESVFSDFRKLIIPGVSRRPHNLYAGHFPARTSYPAILGGMITDAWSNVVISYNSSPSATELEMIVLNWLAKAMDIPKHFFFPPEGTGGSSIMGSITESLLMSVHLARQCALNKLVEKDNVENVISKLIAYKCEETHWSIEKVSKICLVQFRNIPLDSTRKIRKINLEKTIQEDKEKGLIPFYICASLGTPSLCAFDKLDEIGPICERENIWLHVDACYAGNAFICPEFRYLFEGLEYAASFSVSLHTWLPIPKSCTVFWLKNFKQHENTFCTQASYMTCSYSSVMPDFTKYQLRCGRPFRSLKLWFVFRLLGIEYLQGIIRKDVRIASTFKYLVITDGRFELSEDSPLAVVCFRLKGSNKENEQLIEIVNKTSDISFTQLMTDGILYLRFASDSVQNGDINVSHVFENISKSATEVIYKWEMCL